MLESTSTVPCLEGTPEGVPIDLAFQQDIVSCTHNNTESVMRLLALKYCQWLSHILSPFPHSCMHDLNSPEKTNGLLQGFPCTGIHTHPEAMNTEVELHRALVSFDNNG